MALVKTNDAAMPLFVVVTTIIALVLSLYFVQGHGQAIIGTLTSTLFLSFYMASTWVDFDHYFSHVAADCNKLEGCTLDKCHQLCVSLGYTNFTADCFTLLGVLKCCCEYWSPGTTCVQWSNWNNIKNKVIISISRLFYLINYKVLIGQIKIDPITMRAPKHHEPLHL